MGRKLMVVVSERQGDTEEKSRERGHVDTEAEIGVICISA